MKNKILITGSCGLIGTALKCALIGRGYTPIGFDILGQGDEFGDIRNKESVTRVVKGCAGIVNLAAISRVLRAERNPEECWNTNVGGLQIILDEALMQQPKPWIISASSREVYGESSGFPFSETSPLRPINIYGEAKVEGERIVRNAEENGLRTSIVRFSSVYGSSNDHSDRVVPAFARAAATGGNLRVEGAENAFDFTHLDDVVNGLLKIISQFENNTCSNIEPIHFTTGKATSLYELAQMAIGIGNNGATLYCAPPRTNDVSKFCGIPERAEKLLGWAPTILLYDGLVRLISDFANFKNNFSV